jgi:hypothetical protein
MGGRAGHTDQRARGKDQDGRLRIRAAVTNPEAKGGALIALFYLPAGRISYPVQTSKGAANLT